MIVNGYKEKKEQVLAIYDSFVKLCGLAGRPVNNSISSQADKIRAEIFNLMILGEAKSVKYLYQSSQLTDIYTYGNQNGMKMFLKVEIIKRSSSLSVICFLKETL